MITSPSPVAPAGRSNTAVWVKAPPGSSRLSSGNPACPAAANKRDLDLGRELAFRFAEKHLPDFYQKVVDIFHQRGAYARFQDLLEYQDQLEAWHAFEAHETKQALRAWAAEHDFQLGP